MSFNQILKDLKAGQYKPVYFLQGEEPYFIDLIADYIEGHALSESEKSFNQTILYGKDLSDPKVLLDTLMRYPMMASHQVVILKEAQDFKGLEKLESYFEKPLQSTLFVVCHKYKKLRKGTKLQKKIAASGEFFTADKLKDYQVPDYILEKANSLGLKVDNRIAALLFEHLGNDLSKIEKELQKLALNVDKGQPVTGDHIEKFIGYSKDYNVFELTKALVQKDAAKSYRIVQYFIANPKANNIIMINSLLFSFFSKAYFYYGIKNKPERQVMSELKVYPAMMRDLNTFVNNYSPEQAEKVVQTLYEYDLKAKGVGSAIADKSQLLKEMVYRILN